MIPDRFLRAGILRWMITGGLCFIVHSVKGWGPHSEITAAALAALGTNHVLVEHLGNRAQALTNHCWMGDYFGVVMEDADARFYADDYLLFPEAPNYFEHIGPEIRPAFRPFFRRALQALRTENRANAARWLGTLVHFVQDSACPPHAAGLKGDVHSKMENWVETNRIHLVAYRPQSFGATDEQAFEGLLRRLDMMIPAAQERGRRLRVPVEIGNQSAVKPLMLESAIEGARLTADLLHTLGGLVQSVPAGTAILRGTIVSRHPPGLDRFPAKVMLQGTTFSTLANLEGQFEFHYLPAGNYTVIAYRPGNGTAFKEVNLRAGQTNLCDLNLPRLTENLVPNGDFKLKWMRPNAPDYWMLTKSGWENQPIPLRHSQRYRLAVQFKEGARNPVQARWTRTYDHPVPRFKIEPRFKSRTLTPGDAELVLTGGPDCGLIHLTIRGRTSPAAVCESISLVPIQE